MDQTSLEVLRTFPTNKSNCDITSILERSNLHNKVYLQYFLCKLHAWGYLNEIKDSYSITDKGLEYLKGTRMTA